ncbi:MAG: phosphatidylserine decarboxylase [Archaeoglobaceae archaeon]|nr:phosphatidylserine decarboxylase [Archaeoglobaceae archaeon]MCX8152266.1 phosphatidylserine decarboxylase [Archaeoglobaceae archaeon]MDW8013944.1 phosphatidylserine decarboxylase [Archaeoglobaceae archaeon]
MIRKEGFIKILIFSLLSILSFFISVQISVIFLFVTLFLVYFYRDPEREICDGIVSPADGKIIHFSEKRIDIFMRIFDCHVNRAPVSGVVKSVMIKKGEKVPAFVIKNNVYRNEIIIENEFGEFKIVQVAGIFARRISCFVKEGQKVKKGEKIGIIHFGSRVILEVPESVKFVVEKGRKVKAGETVAHIQTS